MKTIKTLLILCLFTSIFTSCNLFRNYTTITTKPDRFFANKVTAQDTSLVSFDLKVDYKSIEKKVNELFSQPFTDSESGEFDEKYQAKTKNIAYDPVEWIKIRDPLYNPKKWLRILGIKTKNPLYHPNKWIKTKNPKYDPNKWIYGDVVRVQVGYTYSYAVEKRGTINFENIGNDVLRIHVPLDIKGTVGFKGDGARLLGLNKKNVKTKIDFFIDTKISFSEDWCPLIKSKINHKWISDPKIEIAGGVWLNLKLPAQLALNNVENELEKEIANKVECTKLQDEIKKWIKPSSFQLTNVSELLYLNANPQQFYLSDLQVTSSDLTIRFAAKLLLGLSTTKRYENQSQELPKLEKYAFKENIIALTVPLAVEYDVLQNELNALLEKEELTYEEKRTKIKVKEFEIYPSGEALTIGVDISAKLPGNLLSTNGKIYLTAEPHINNKKFELKNISFSTQLDNEIYPIVAAVFKKKIIKYIHSATQKDLTKQFDQAESILQDKLTEQLKTYNNMDVTVDEIRLDIPYISILEKEFSIPVRLATGVDIKVKSVW
ncbi:DUF4403 family protein [Tenacibaculum agarivorans]|uniref:DUF4403 family protein n=1 Tax=Tenacibaculum agarivorans TaxID=1908389 RepID=UPI00094BA00B|nr:DUF4403 family protein [Tenacibaculum agarivorans]